MAPTATVFCMTGRSLSAGVRSGTGSGQSWTPVRRLVTRLQLRAVVQGQAAGDEFLQVAVERVLIEGDERVDLIAVVEGLPGRDAEAQPGVPAANHRLVAVVGVDGLTLPGHRESQGIAGRGDAVACGTADSDDYIRLVHDVSSPNFDPPARR